MSSSTNVRRPLFDRSPRNGFRLAYYPDTTGLTRSIFGLSTPYFGIDFKLEKPVHDEVFRIYREQFAYDKRRTQFCLLKNEIKILTAGFMS